MCAISFSSRNSQKIIVNIHSNKQEFYRSNSYLALYNDRKHSPLGFSTNYLRAFRAILLSSLIFSINAMWPEKASERLIEYYALTWLSKFNGLPHLFVKESINHCLQRPDGFLVFFGFRSV